MNKTILALLITAIGLCASVGGALVVVRNLPQTQPKNLGSTDLVLPAYPTATKVWVGLSDTLVVATSSGRVRLEIGNISGATSSPQALYCNTGDRPSVLYEGTVVHASSTAVWTLDNLMRGAIRCRLPVASSSVTVMDY